MFGDVESPPTPKEKEFIRHAVDQLRRSLSDDLARAVLDGPCERILKGVKRDLIEIEVKPDDDWAVKGSVFKHKTRGLEISSARWQEICERTWFKHRWHFETHDNEECPKYVILLKCFGEVLGKKQSEIASMDFSLASDDDIPKKKDKRKKSSTSLSNDIAAEHAPVQKKKSRRSKMVEPSKDKRGSKDVLPEIVVPASTDASQRARHLRRKGSNLSNSSSSRT